MRFSPFSAYGGGQPGTLAGYSWLCFLPLATRRFDQLSPWVTIAPLWLSFRQSSLHPRTQFLSQSLSRHLLIGGLAPFPTCFGHCSWFPSQLSRMITGLCVSPGALLSAHFCSARAAFLRLTGAPSRHPHQRPVVLLPGAVLPLFDRGTYRLPGLASALLPCTSSFFLSKSSVQTV